MLFIILNRNRREIHKRLGLVCFITSRPSDLYMYLSDFIISSLPNHFVYEKDMEVNKNQMILLRSYSSITYHHVVLLLLLLLGTTTTTARRYRSCTYPCGATVAYIVVATGKPQCRLTLSHYKGTYL